MLYIKLFNCLISVLSALQNVLCIVLFGCPFLHIISSGISNVNDIIRLLYAFGVLLPFIQCCTADLSTFNMFANALTL